MRLSVSSLNSLTLLDEAAELDRLAECVRLAYEDPDIYIRQMIEPHVLYVKWKRAAILQGGLC